MMTASIQDFPPELFPLILKEACGLSVDCPGRRHLHRRQCRSLLTSAMIFSSVCRGWRHIVMDMPIFWTTLEFASFLRPSPAEARTCIIQALQYSASRLQCICLNFSSLQGVPNGEYIVDETLKTVLGFVPNTWNELCITVTEVDHFDVISDSFSCASDARKRRLASVATLRLNFPQDSAGPSTSSMPQDSLSNYHPRNEVLPTYSFVTPLFKSVNDIHLTNVRLLSIGERSLRIHLDNWTNIIDETFFMKTKGDRNADLQMARHHIITNSAANMINCSLKPTVTSLTIVLPDVDFQTLSLAPSTASPFTSGVRFGYYIAVWPHIMALRNGAASLEFIELINVTPEAWLTFLAFLKPIPIDPSLPGPLQTTLPKHSWKHIVVRFAPHHRQPQAISPSDRDMSVRLRKKLHLGFDFRAKSNMVISAGDMGALMSECLAKLTRRMLPGLEKFDWYDPRGWHSHLDMPIVEGLLA